MNLVLIRIHHPNQCTLCQDDNPTYIVEFIDDAGNVINNWLICIKCYPHVEDRLIPISNI